jgi:hypothetical protein
VSRLAEFPLEGGGSVVVEVAESELPEGPVRAHALVRLQPRPRKALKLLLPRCVLLLRV